jgi:hypothetical protein
MPRLRLSVASARRVYNLIGNERCAPPTISATAPRSDRLRFRIAKAAKEFFVGAETI